MTLVQFQCLKYDCHFSNKGQADIFNEPTRFITLKTEQKMAAGVIIVSVVYMSLHEFRFMGMQGEVSGYRAALTVWDVS